MKSSPWSKVTAKVRPVFSSLAFISVPGLSDMVAAAGFGCPACLSECLLDLRAAGGCGYEHLQQQASFDWRQVAGTDQAPIQEVSFGSGKAVGLVVDRPSARPRREDN